MSRTRHPSYLPTYRIALAALALPVLFAVAGSASAGELGRCIRAEVPAPVLLPNGEVGDPGLLRICYRNALSPVMGLHEISMNGATAGLFSSRTSPGARPEHERLAKRTDQPYLVFLRTDAGQLVLLSYHRPMGDRLSSHILLPSRNPEVRSYWKTAVTTGEPQSYDLATVLDRDDTLILAATGP